MIIYETRSSIMTPILVISNLGNKILLVIGWNFLNMWINGILKNLIKQPRPKRMIKINRNDVINSRHYGMPSGHAQIAATNSVFIALLFRNEIITSLALLQTLLTIYQRYSFRMHSLSQLLVGSVIGGMSGYILYKLYNHLYINPQPARETEAKTSRPRHPPDNEHTEMVRRVLQ